VLSGVRTADEEQPSEGPGPAPDAVPPTPGTEGSGAGGIDETPSTSQPTNDFGASLFKDEKELQWLAALKFYDPAGFGAEQAGL
jgi:hypothetical protein